MLRPEKVGPRPLMGLSTMFGKGLPWMIATLVGMSMPLPAQENLEAPPDIPPIDAKERPLPPKVEGEEIEPTVTIRQEEDRTVEEYRFNGQIYMVKVTPKIGLPYYLIDSDGNGMLEPTDNKGLAPVNPVYWKVKEWE
jgi:hypothetical protein